MKAEDRLRATGCPKINRQVQRSNVGVIAFHTTLGYREDDVVSMAKRLESNDDAH